MIVQGSSNKTGRYCFQISLFYYGLCITGFLPRIKNSHYQIQFCLPTTAFERANIYQIKKAEFVCNRLFSRKRTS